VDADVFGAVLLAGVLVASVLAAGLAMADPPERKNGE